MPYETILYEPDGAIATITLNRPDRLNTIVPPMPDERDLQSSESEPQCHGLPDRQDVDHPGYPDRPNSLVSRNRNARDSMQQLRQLLSRRNGRLSRAPSDRQPFSNGNQLRLH